MSSPCLTSTLNFNMSMLNSMIKFSYSRGSLELYFRKVFSSLQNSNNEIDLLILYNYLSLPFFLSEIFYRYMNPKEGEITEEVFVETMCGFFLSNSEEKIKNMFNFLDTMNCGYIEKKDMKIIFAQFHSLGTCNSKYELTEIIDELFSSKNRINFKYFKEHIQTNSDLFYLFYFYLNHFRPFSEESVFYFDKLIGNKTQLNLDKEKEDILNFPSKKVFDYLNWNFGTHFIVNEYSQIDDSEISELNAFEKDLKKITNSIERIPIKFPKDLDSTSTSDDSLNKYQFSALKCYNEDQQEFNFEIISPDIFLYDPSKKYITVIPTQKLFVEEKNDKEKNCLIIYSTIRNQIQKLKLLFETSKAVKKVKAQLKTITNYRSIDDFYSFSNKIEDGIYVGNHNVTGKEKIIKIINKNYSDGDFEDLKLARSEQDISRFLIKMKNPGICQIYDVFEDLASIYIVEEYFKNGTLKTYVATHNVSNEVIMSIIAQIVSSVDFLHSYGILHRDLKLENIMVCYTEDMEVKVKIIDFGISRVITQNEMLTARYGTPQNLPPEIIKNRYYSFNSDVWGFGIISYYLMFKSHPFYGKTLRQLEKDITEKDPDFSQNRKFRFNEKLVELIKSCLEKNEIIRPMIIDVQSKMEKIM